MATTPTTPTRPNEQTTVSTTPSGMSYKLTYASFSDATTVSVAVPSAESTCVTAAHVREKASEFDRFLAFAKKVVAVPKREMEGQRRAELASKDARFQSLLAASALLHESGTQGQPDDPQGLTDRIERLKQS